MRLRLIPLLVLAVAFAGPACVRNFAKPEVLLPGVDTQRCRVHNVPLQTNVVRLYYGLPPKLSDGYLKTRENDFPNARLAVNGGCMVNPFYRKAKVLACPRCNAAEQEWVKTHCKYEYECEDAAKQPQSTEIMRGDAPDNMPIKLSVRPVTPLAEVASGAPVRPAAYRRR